MSTHILEILSCASALLREQYKIEVEASGAYVVDEKFNFDTKAIKFYLILKMGDRNTEESLIRKIKASTSGLSENCSYLIRITRGTDKKQNLL